VWVVEGGMGDTVRKMFGSVRRYLATVGLTAVALAGPVAVDPPLGASPPAARPAAAPPTHDPFYQPPAPLPAAPPGTLIRSRPTTVYATPGEVVPVPVRAWEVLYLSTSALGQPNAVSGTVLVPERPWFDGLRPLVTYAVGTHGLGDHCAPSYQMRSGTEGELSLMDHALAQGWAVVVTDYEGLGTPGTHTYTVGRSEGHAVLDGARAAQRLSGAGLSAEGPVGIWGYSQGGQAAAWAGQLQASYAPELRVAGVAAGGVPADLATVARHVDGGPAAGLVLAGAVGQGAAYPELPLDSMLNDTGKAAAARIANSCTDEIVAEHAYRRAAEYSTIPDPLGEPHFAARLAENRLGGQAPAAPVLLYHGTADELIPLPVAERLFSDYCTLGAGVRWEPMPLLGHVQAAVASPPVVVPWLADRFARRAAPSSC
jgi:hypothetical protein